METLSLKTPHSAQKNLSDVVSKGESNINGISASNEQTPFHHELAKQVRAKKQTSQTEQARPTNPHNSINSKNKQVQNTQSTRALEHKPEVDNRAASISELDSISELLGLQQVESMLDSQVLSETKSNKDIDAKEFLINQDITADALAGASLIVPTLVTVALKSQVDGYAGTVDLNSTEQSGLSDTSPETKSLDSLLSNSLSQSKPANSENVTNIVSDPASNVTNIVSDPASGKVNIQIDARNNMQDKSFQIAPRDESLANKGLSNALNEIVTKETTPTSFVASQPQALQAHQNVAASQQLGSTNLIYAYPGKTGWDQAISQKVIWMVGAGEQTASLTLNPPDLGPLKVVIRVHNDQADTTFISDNDEVRKALESGLSNLRDKMSDSGIQLGQTNVSTSSQSQQNFQQAAQSRADRLALNATSAQQSEVIATAPVFVRASNGLVDTFA